MGRRASRSASSITRSAILAFAFLGAIVVACSDSDRPGAYTGLSYSGVPSTEGGTYTQTTDGSASETGTTTDSSVDAGFCENRPQLGTLVKEVFVGGTPASTGTTLPSGTYVLTGKSKYGADPDAGDGGVIETGSTAKFTLYVEGNTLTFIGARDANPEISQSSTFVVKPTGGLDIISTCPIGGARGDYGFNFDGTKLELFINPSQLDRSETYTRQP